MLIVGVERANEPARVHEFDLFEQDNSAHEFDVMQYSARYLIKSCLSFCKTAVQFEIFLVHKIWIMYSLL